MAHDTHPPAAPSEQSPVLGAEGLLWAFFHCGDAVTSAQLREGQAVVIGRGREADVRVSDTAMSRSHFELKRIGARVILRDLDSRNGTFLNGSRLDSACRVTLLDTVTAGSVVIWLQSVGPAEDPARQSTKVSRAPSDTLDLSQQAYVMVSEPLKRVCAMAQRVARSDVPVLICGETGSGKEGLARLVHEGSERGAASFLAINCAAIPESLLESSLFGHERGAFTGAERQKKGVMEAAEGGTLFLDEIAELSLSAQAALLRATDTKRVQRVGGTKEIPVDVRIVAATHQDLEARVREGTFRQDLFFRLNAVILTLPPLRERVADIGPLAHHFLIQSQVRGATAALGLSEEALEALGRYSWPGNVRELRNAIDYASIHAEGEEILVDDLPERVSRDAEQATLSPALLTEHRENDGRPFKERVQQYEKFLLVEALKASGWNQSQAARCLQMPLRTFTHKLRSLGLKK